MYDIHTKNISFLKMAKYLKEKGIKKYAFMLKLYDKTLVGVDPYSSNLTSEQQIRIRKEIMINYWYYIREVVKIPSTGNVVPYEINKGTMATTFLQLKNINNILELPRQHGKTWSIDCFYTWVFLFTATNFTMVFSNKQLEDSRLNIKRFKSIVESLPSYLKLHMDTKKDTDNIDLVRIDSLNNTIRSLSTGKDKASADKLGRGLNIPILWLDEFAFLNNNEITYKAARPALTKASEAAKQSGQPYGITITTTPRMLGCMIVISCYNFFNCWDICYTENQQLMY